MYKRIGSGIKASLVDGDKNPYARLTLDEAERKLEKLQAKHLIRKVSMQGKKVLLAEHIAELKS